MNKEERRNEAEPGTSLDVDAEGIAVITLRNPPVNALHPRGAWVSLYRIEWTACILYVFVVCLMRCSMLLGGMGFGFARVCVAKNHHTGVCRGTGLAS